MIDLERGAAPCSHDLGEQETACADGLCPLCLVAELRQARDVIKAADAMRDQFLAYWHETEPSQTPSTPIRVYAYDVARAQCTSTL